MKDGLVHRVWISLGTNLGNRAGQLSNAREHMVFSCGGILRASAVYESTPMGFESEHMFFNQCILLETHLSPVALLQVLLGIEGKMGRNRNSTGYTDRPIDLDILYYDDLVIDSEQLMVPHPRMTERKFVLQPLSEIAAEKRDPVKGMTVAELLAQCDDPSPVKKVLL